MSADGTRGSEAAPLLAVLERDRERRCRELLESARAKAAADVRAARREARRRVHRAIDEERRRAAAAVEAAASRLETLARERRHQHAGHLLERGWELLRRALRERWAQPESRRSWCRAALEQALAVLQPGDWQVAHPPEWDPGELEDELLARVAARAGNEPAFAPQADLPAGLRIRAGGAVLDATLEGLLVDRARVEGMLLDAYARLAGDETPTPVSAEGDRESGDES